MTIVPLRDNHWLRLTADGHYQGSPKIEDEIVYVLETEAGQETRTPAGFAKRFGWKNDPKPVRDFGGSGQAPAATKK